MADAVDVARRALLELEPAAVGVHLGVTAENDSAATHRFEATLRGYRGWQWAVVVAAPPGAEHATVSESALLPGPDALVAPDFVPWDQRVRPGDLAPGDLLAPAHGDPRLVPGHTVCGDPAVDEVAVDIGLGRTKVMSLEGREEAAERWFAEYGPDTDMAKAAPSTCGRCGFYLPLAGSLRAAFGVCGNTMGADGRVVHSEYGCGAHSDVEPPAGNGSPQYEAYDDAAYDVFPHETVRPEADSVEPEASTAAESVAEANGSAGSEAERAGADAVSETVAQPNADAENSGAPGAMTAANDATPGDKIPTGTGSVPAEATSADAESADAVTAGVSSADAAPADTVSADAVSAEAVPDAVRADADLAGATSTDVAAPDAVATDRISTDTAPTDVVPAGAASADAASAEAVATDADTADVVVTDAVSSDAAASEKGGEREGDPVGEFGLAAAGIAPIEPAIAADINPADLAAGYLTAADFDADPTSEGVLAPVVDAVVLPVESVATEGGSSTESHSAENETATAAAGLGWVGPADVLSAETAPGAVGGAEVVDAAQTTEAGPEAVGGAEAADTAPSSEAAHESVGGTELVDAASSVDAASGAVSAQEAAPIAEGVGTNSAVGAGTEDGSESGSGFWSSPRN
nr:DUF3027 domain-containing protein [Nocardia bovistercoris]